MRQVGPAIFARPGCQKELGLDWPIPDRRLHRTMEFSWQSSESAQTATIDHDVGTSMSTMVLYGILATWCSSLALMAYLMRPLPHQDVD